jgi:hypothetical protein
VFGILFLLSKHMHVSCIIKQDVKRQLTSKQNEFHPNEQRNPKSKAIVLSTWMG